MKKQKAVLLTFSQALCHLKEGKRIRRKGWPKKILSIASYLTKGGELICHVDTKCIEYLGDSVDLLSEDWTVAE